MSDLISRKWLMECVDEGWIKFDTEKDKNIYVHLVRDIAPSAQPYTAEEIQKMQELESAQVEKAYELGRESAQPEQIWIPVTERLPDNADHSEAFCPRYQVTTPYGVTEGWYRPHDHEKGGQWYALFWFMSHRYEIWNIDFERGDVPKVIGEAPVMAWRPFPEAYKEGEQE